VLEIGGQRLRLHANADPQHLVQLAQLVNEHYANMQSSTRSSVPSTVLALTALDLADELLRARRREEEAREEARRATAAAEARVREVEQMARQAIRDAIEEIDRTLAHDDALAGRREGDGESETA
jgi:cell division protein ZapA (FtsZ GTPase activity inhibitor)